jgi:transcriptional regulator with XRE-family HTH domain
MMKRLSRRVDREGGDRAIWIFIGNRLRARRRHLRLAICGVAENLGIDPEEYEQYESGVELAPAQLIAKIADLFGVPMLWFLQDAVREQRTANRAEASGPRHGYRVATVEDRIGFLAASFRQLDLEGQQHLLAIAAELCRHNRKQ